MKLYTNPNHAYELIGLDVTLKYQNPHGIFMTLKNLFVCPKKGITPNHSYPFRMG